MGLTQLLVALSLAASVSSGPAGAERLTLHSQALGEERVSAVVMPASYGRGQQRYPVLYLTDAEAQLGHTRTTADFLARNGLMPEVIVVGILNTQRTRDLTPTAGTAAEHADYPTAGGGERFLDFLEHELVPAVEARYRTVPLRLYAGHSFGGLLGVHALLSRAGLFQAVVAASPSLGWDDGLVLREARALKAGRPPLPRGLYVTLGGREASPEVLEDFESFAKAMQHVPWPNFDWAWQLVPDEDHGSTVLLGYYAGLRHLFAGWRMPLEAPAATAPPSLAQLLAHFQGLSERWGYSVEPPEALVDLLGYVALRQKALGEALELFRYNVAAYPESANAQESLGLALARAGQLDAARECYRQAVELAEKSGDPQLAPLRARLDALDERLQTPPSSGP
ncbi:MAG: alpha/beta hydrolase-fold protein [Myxococcaceae bacterium]